MTNGEDHNQAGSHPGGPEDNPTSAMPDAAEIDRELKAAIGDTEQTLTPKPASTPAPKAAPPSVSNDLENEIEAALAGVDLDALADEPEPRAGEQIKLTAGRRTRSGVIVNIRDGEVFVEFGPKSQGFCPLKQFDTPPDIGSSAEFVVERLDSEGMLVLSVPGAVQKADWGSLEIGQTIEGRCIGLNKGGLEIEVAHQKGFMPAGQVDIRHIPDISVFLGEKLTCRVTQLDRKRGKLILSRRAVIEEERAAGREKILAELAPGQRRTAVVTSVQAYGAFADLGGIDGLIHVTEISHDRIRDPGDVLKAGDELEVQVLKVDTSGDQPKIALSRKAVVADPRVEAMNDLAEGETVSGTVTKLVDFGAFIQIGPGVEGLAHISELSHERIPSADAVLREGEVVQAKILSMDQDRGRVSLSLKALQDRPAAPAGGKKQGGGRAEPARPEDPAMRKLRSKFSGDLKGGLG